MSSVLSAYFIFLIGHYFVNCDDTHHYNYGGGTQVFGANSKVTGKGGHFIEENQGTINFGYGGSTETEVKKPVCRKVLGEKEICTCSRGTQYSSDGTHKCIHGPSDRPHDLFCFANSSRCFKFILPKSKWEKAGEACKGEGLVLAEPAQDEALVLRQYINETKEDSDIGGYAWLGAQGTAGNSCRQTWTRKGGPTMASLWRIKEDPDCLNCLVMLIDESFITVAPGKPYGHFNCNLHKYPALCELV